jgi:hypothetical protein
VLLYTTQDRDINNTESHSIGISQVPGGTELFIDLNAQCGKVDMFWHPKFTFGCNIHEEIIHPLELWVAPRWIVLFGMTLTTTVLIFNIVGVSVCIGTHFATYIFQNRVVSVGRNEVRAKNLSSHTVFDARDRESELDAFQA